MAKRPSKNWETAESWSPAPWGARHGFGRTTTFELLRSGRGPKVIYPTPRTPRITRQAEQEWLERLAREADQPTLAPTKSRGRKL